MSAPRHRAEFDSFAPGYDAGMGVSLKRLAGRDADTFLAHKANWLVHNLTLTGRLLDFGCGTGRFLRALRLSGRPLELVGCDVSAGMIEAGRGQWDAGSLPILHVVPAGPLPFADGEFDLVTATCVLHHIARAERPGVVRELVRVVRRGGTVVLFEHNPANPLTRWAVRRTPIDTNAVLLPVAESMQLLQGAGAVRCRTDHILFFPPRLRRLWQVERLLSRLPIGAQYVTTGTKPP